MITRSNEKQQPRQISSGYLKHSKSRKEFTMTTKITGALNDYPCGRIISELFAGWQETLIWSCLDGTMGDVYVTDTENPVSVMAILGDFCFFAGVPDSELAELNIEERPEFLIMVPQNEGWENLIEQIYSDKAKKTSRYAIKKEPDIFDYAKLQAAVDSLDPAYSMKLIDEDLYNYCRSNDWSWFFVSQYPDYETYEKLGLGVVILKDGEPVSGVSSYTSYRGGIEIEIDTKKEYTRKGLAYACAARLILECRKRGLYPSWDAQNKWSLALAEKLGYHFDHEYTAYEVAVTAR